MSTLSRDELAERLAASGLLSAAAIGEFVASGDEGTVALYRFEEGTGDELQDSSKNKHHGQIVGAKWVRRD